MTSTPATLTSQDQDQAHKVAVAVLTATANLASISFYIWLAFYLTSRQSGTYAFALLVSGTYLGALTVKTLLPSQYSQPAPIIGLGFWLCLSTGAAVFFGLHELLGFLDVPVRTQKELQPFMAPVVIGAGSYCNYWLCQRNFGFSGPVRWQSTTATLLLLAILLAATSYTPKPSPKFHHYDTPTQVTF